MPSGRRDSLPAVLPAFRQDGGPLWPPILRTLFPLGSGVVYPPYLNLPFAKRTLESSPAPKRVAPTCPASRTGAGGDDKTVHVVTEASAARACATKRRRAAGPAVLWPRRETTAGALAPRSSEVAGLG